MRKSAKRSRIGDRRTAHRTDWAKLKAKTEEEIEAAALADPDNPPLTEDELARLRPVPFARRVRLKLGLSQEGFSNIYNIPLATLRDWEQGRATPDQQARSLLCLIDARPTLVRRLLAERRAENTRDPFIPRTEPAR